MSSVGVQQDAPLYHIESECVKGIFWPSKELFNPNHVIVMLAGLSARRLRFLRPFAGKKRVKTGEETNWENWFVDYKLLRIGQDELHFIHLEENKELLKRRVQQGDAGLVAPGGFGLKFSADVMHAPIPSDIYNDRSSKKSFRWEAVEQLYDLEIDKPFNWKYTP